MQEPSRARSEWADGFISAAVPLLVGFPLRDSVRVVVGRAASEHRVVVGVLVCLLRYFLAPFGMQSGRCARTEILTARRQAATAPGGLAAAQMASLHVVFVSESG